ncbi:MAG: type IV secretory system conjugative DNA transfer family protein [Burkholderiales bacterium]|jgi:type IV secretion system protein VirD4|nr:type IV secretory system conjugative DNA transfer family protein [Burkholderiales bacterium]
MTRSDAAPPSTARVAAALVVALVVTLYAAGYFLLWSLKLPPLEASPLTLPRYAYHYWPRPEVRARIVWSGLGALAIVSGLGALALWPRSRSLHGDARFAVTREIRNAGLFAEQGILLGAYKGRFLTLPGQQGVILAAPPRSGKGVGVVVPNLLNWHGSVICLDVKRENWTLTAGFRAQYGEVFLFDPFAADGRTAHWNPLSYVLPDPNLRIDDLQRIAAMLCVEVPGSDPFWVKSARSLFLGIALYLFERRDYERAHNATATPRDRIPEVPVTIGEVLRQAMASDEEGFGAHWKRIIEGWAALGKPLSPACVALVMDVVDLAPQTASSVRKTFTSQLDLWLNPLLDLATASDDFDLRSLRKRRISIYVGVKPRDFERLQAVMNLFFQQAIGEQTNELPEHNPELKHPLLVLLDEFTAVGRIPILLSSIAFVPGYNVRTLMVIQTPSQLQEVYGPHGAKIMLKTVAARIVFAPNDAEDARQISEELGHTTVRAKSRTLPAWMSGKNRSPSVTVSEQRRALLLPQEVKAMGAHRELVFLENLRPVRAEKIRYYADPRFKARLLPPPGLAPAPLVHAPRARTDDHFGLWQGALIGRGAKGPAHPASTPPAAGTATAVRGSDTALTPAVAAADALDEAQANVFSVDFSHVVLPPRRPLTPEELDRAVDRFLDTLPTLAET